MFRDYLFIDGMVYENVTMNCWLFMVCSLDYDAARESFIGKLLRKA